MLDEILANTQNLFFVISSVILDIILGIETSQHRRTVQKWKL